MGAYDSVYLSIVALVGFIVVVVAITIGYFVWADSQPTGWQKALRTKLAKPIFGDGPPSPPKKPSNLRPFDAMCTVIDGGNIPTTCTDVNYSKTTGIIHANCQDNGGNFAYSTMDVNNCSSCAVTNVNGTIGCANGQKVGECASFGGDWSKECEAIMFNPLTGVVTASCPARGGLNTSTLDITTCNADTGCLINNVDGKLTCTK